MYYTENKRILGSLFFPALPTKKKESLAMKLSVLCVHLFPCEAPQWARAGRLWWFHYLCPALPVTVGFELGGGALLRWACVVCGG